MYTSSWESVASQLDQVFILQTQPDPEVNLKEFLHYATIHNVDVRIIVPSIFLQEDAPPRGTEMGVAASDKVLKSQGADIPVWRGIHPDHLVLTGFEIRGLA